MIKAKFIRINPKTHHISWDPKATFIKTFGDIEELIKFISNCKYALLIRSTMSSDEIAIFRSKIFAATRKKLNDY